MVSIKDMDKAAVLAALYNGTSPRGPFGRFFASEPTMTIEDARQILSERGSNRSDLYFDYLKGRPLKVHLFDDELDVRLYDRDAGEGAAARAIELASRIDIKPKKK